MKLCLVFFLPQRRHLWTHSLTLFSKYSADVARCRVASKAFNTAFPFLRSINLQCPMSWYAGSSSQVSSYKSVFLDLVSTLKSVESVCIGYVNPLHATLYCRNPGLQDFYLTDNDFLRERLPKVAESLKSLSIYDLGYRMDRHILPMISKYCHNLVNLNLKNTWLSAENLNPMPMLTSLTLESTRLKDEHLNKMNTCFPNLQVLNLLDPVRLEDPKIHLLNLKACHWDVYDVLSVQTLTIIAPKLITLEIRCNIVAAVHIDAPMLSHFHLIIEAFQHVGTFNGKKFENLKTLLLESHDLGSVLSKFPITKTVENLTLLQSGEFDTNAGDSKLSLVKVLIVFLNVSALCVNSSAWLELEGQEILDGGIGLKTLCAYLMLVDPSLTFSYVASVLDQCGSMSQVSFLIRGDVSCYVSESFKSKCMARWPGLKWRWGIWNDDSQDSWINR